MKFLTILKLLISMLPLVIDAMRAIEDAIPGQGQGEQKLAALRAMIESTYSAANDIGVTFGDIWPVLEKTVGTLVGAFNQSGAFKK